MYPHGLALDPHGNIHVAEHVSIKVFTEEGVYVRTYGEFKSESPWCIAIDDEGNTCVCDSECLYVFDHHGNKIHEVGNLTNPIGIALDPRDGSVYVADFSDNSVLKYSVV